MVIDIEVGIDKENEFGHPERYQFLCVGIGYASGKVVVIGEEALKFNSVCYELGELIRSCKWVCQNGKFDMAGLSILGDGELYFDTMLASYAMDERRGIHGLDVLAQEFLGAPNWKHVLDPYVHKTIDKKRVTNYAWAPRDILYEYNAKDVANTYWLWELFEQQMDEDARSLHQRMIRTSGNLMKSEMRGIRVDEEYLHYLEDHFLDSLKDYEEKLQPWVRNPRSPKQVKEALHKLGHKVVDTREDTLTFLAETGIDPESEAAVFIDLLLGARKDQKLYGTYVKGIRTRLYEGRVHPSFLLHGTTTGRQACRNPNMFNVPRGPRLRRMFIPDEGLVFVQVDYRTAELRVIATEAQDEYLHGAFLDPSRDIHGEVATRLYGPGWTTEQRVRAKAYVFGLGYGREEYSIAREFRISVAEARKGIRGFFSMIPQVAQWQARMTDQILHSGEDLVNHFGRHRRFWLINKDNRKEVVKEGLAFIPQSTASDICVEAYNRLAEEGLPLLVSVYDSILTQCKPEQAEEIGAHMADVMQQTALDIYTDYVPFEAEVKIGPDWGSV